MKKILSFVLVLMLAFSLVVDAATTHTFKISTDKTSVAAGEKVLVTIELTGATKNISSILTEISYDADLFSIDTTQVYHDEEEEDWKYPVCINYDWIDPIYGSNKKKKNAFTYISMPSVVDANGLVKVLYVDSSGAKITSEATGIFSESADKVSDVIKLEFVAKSDIATIDNSIFKLETASAVLTNDSNQTVPVESTIVQLPASTPVEPPAPAGPAWEKLDNVTVVEFVGEDTEDQDYAYAVDFVANDAAKLIYSVAADNARLYSEVQPVAGLAGAIKAGFVSRTQYDAASVGVLLTNAAEDTIWYSVDADKAE